MSGGHYVVQGVGNDVMYRGIGNNVMSGVHNVVRGRGMQ